ncbi:MAG: helix-turn-helix transcriptional regulator [Pseudomonadota bacterium]
MLLLDAVIRFATVGLLLNLVLSAVLSGARHLVLRIGIALSISVAAILINSSSFAIGDAFRDLLRALEAPNVALLWWFGLAVFIDDFRLRWVHWFGMIISTGLALSARFDALGGLVPLGELRLPVLYALSFVLMGHLLWTVARDAAGDLLNARRSIRVWIVVGFVVVSIGIAVAEITLPHAVQSFLRAAVLLPIVAVVSWWMAPFRPERAIFEPRSSGDSRAAKADTDGVDDGLADALHRAMVVEAAYLEPGLTVAGLAHRVAVPAHRLRAYINRKTGFRNFPAYVNHYRLEAAKTALRDPALARGGILAIALDSGFASLATFNRVFKASEGITPSEYRTRSTGE